MVRRFWICYKILTVMVEPKKWIVEIMNLHYKNWHKRMTNNLTRYIQFELQKQIYLQKAQIILWHCNNAMWC